MKNNLAKASIMLGFQVYMGMMVFTSLVFSLAVFLFSLYLLPLSIKFQIINVYVLPILISVLSGSSLFGVLYLYPKFIAYSKSRTIEANLPFIANFLSVLASSGMPPGKILQSFANVGEEFKIKEETGAMLWNIDVMGEDIFSALNETSLRSPSSKFATLLDGVIATSHMGGDLAGFLREQADKYKRTRVITMKSFLDNLSVIAEVYITLMVAAPLMLIVMLSAMSFLGGSIVLGGIDPKVLLYLLTFVVVPAGVIILILVVDSITPPR